MTTKFSLRKQYQHSYRTHRWKMADNGPTANPYVMAASYHISYIQFKHTAKISNIFWKKQMLLDWCKTKKQTNRRLCRIYQKVLCREHFPVNNQLNTRQQSTFEPTCPVIFKHAVTTVRYFLNIGHSFPWFVPKAQCFISKKTALPVFRPKGNISIITF